MTTHITAFAGAVLVVLAGFRSATASTVQDSLRVAPCSPRAALALGLVIPGGGQFYLRDWSGGIQAVATDVLLIEALRRSDATASGIVFFVGAVHLVEGLFAMQDCHTRIRSSAARVSAYPVVSPFNRAGPGEPVMVALSLPLARSPH